MMGEEAAFSKGRIIGTQHPTTKETGPTLAGWGIVLGAALLYAATLGTLGVLQYRAMHVPHGDSGMYEEHLWNVLHGKGFRSQIDDGRLFLGEHLQVIHLALLPIYVLWPSLETLQVAESVALASGAAAIYLLASTMGVSSAGVPLAVAYLLYFPLQYLNLELSWKTFRPEAFGVPLLLWGLWAMECRRWWIASLLMLLTLLAKEDYGITIAAVGLWVVGKGLAGRPVDSRSTRWGIVWVIVSAGLVLWVVRWMIPYFRGDIPHFSRYFEGLGETPVEVATTFFTQPGLVLERWLTPENGWFVAMMLGPLLFVPLADPGRLAVAAPAFAYLTLASREGLATPWFHFHAPLLPILFWASVAGVRQFPSWIPPRFLAGAIMVACLVSGFVFGRSPLSARFYDPSQGIPTKPWAGQTLFEPMGSYFRDLYLPSERSRQWDEVMKVLDPEDRVAATDYARTRLTHFRSAYVYPEFRPHMSIDDVDALVIDRTEGWWGRGPSNPDRELLLALAREDGLPKELTIRGRPFRVLLNTRYWWVARQLRPASDSSAGP
jgi:uncharacterized membrane protein